VVKTIRDARKDFPCLYRYEMYCYCRERRKGMGVIMTVAEMVDNVIASFEMEGFSMTEEDRQRGIDILEGNVDVEQIIDNLKKKYASLSQV